MRSREEELPIILKEVKRVLGALEKKGRVRIGFSITDDFKVFTSVACEHYVLRLGGIKFGKRFNKTHVAVIIYVASKTFENRSGDLSTRTVTDVCGLGTRSIEKQWKRAHDELDWTEINKEASKLVLKDIFARRGITLK